VTDASGRKIHDQELLESIKGKLYQGLATEDERITQPIG
jgi:hypothetical protein